MRYLAPVALVVATLGLNPAAHAALVNCDASMYTDPTSHVENAAGTLTAVDGCQYLSPPDNSNTASISNINTGAFFGYSDWTANGGNLQLNANAATGSWAISGANFALYDYIIVFKDGDGTNLIAFSFNELFSSGTWSTPFTDPPFDLSGTAAHDVSHYTIAQRLADDPTDPPQELPEPASLALVGMALTGVGLARRRRR